MGNIRSVDEIMAVIDGHLAALPSPSKECTVSKLMSDDEVYNRPLCENVIAKLNEVGMLCYYDPREVEGSRKWPISVSPRRPSITVCYVVRP